MPLFIVQVTKLVQFAHRINGFSDLVHRPDSKELDDKTRRFGNWNGFHSQVRGDTYSVGSLRKS
jgi:hypothetical protein